MPALTWRQVAAPDFSGTSLMYKTVADQLSRATASASEGLKDWQGARMATAEDQIAQQASKFTSPEAYRAALESGQILGSVDQGLIGRKLIETAAGQESAIAAREKRAAQYEMPTIEGLFQQALLNKDEAALSSLAQENAKKLRLADSPFADPFKVQGMLETVKNNDARKSAPYIENAILAASAAGFPDNAAAARNNNMEVLQRANSPMFAQAAVEGVVNKDWLTKITNAVGEQTTSNSKLSILQQAEKTATPSQKALLYKQFPSMNEKGTLLAAAEEAGPSIAAAAKSTYASADEDPTSGANKIVGDGKFIPPSLGKRLITQLSMGELEPIQKELINLTMGRTDVFKELSKDTGSSALGKYQIVRRTLNRVAPEVFGKDWKNVQFNEANQDKLGEYLFNETVRSGMKLSKQWVGLGKKEFGGKYNDPAKAKNFTWDEVKKDLLASESAPDKQYTRSEANAGATLVKAAAEAQSSQLSANPAVGYVDEEVTSIGNNDFSGAYKYFLKQSAVPDKNFNQRQFMDLYAQYGKVQTPASVAEMLKNPKASPIYEPVPLGVFSLALSRAVKNAPDFGSTSDKPLNGRLLSRLVGQFSPNDYFFGSKKLADELTTATNIDPRIAQNSVKQSKLLAAAADAAPPKLDELKQAALNWRKMSDIKPNDTALKKQADVAEAIYQAAINKTGDRTVPDLAQTLQR